MTDNPTKLIRYLSQLPAPLSKGVVDIAFIRAGMGTHKWESIRAGFRDTACSRRVDPRAWGPPRRRRLYALLNAVETHLGDIQTRHLAAFDRVACYVYPYVIRGPSGFYEYRLPSDTRLGMLRAVLPRLLRLSCICHHKDGRFYVCVRPLAASNPVWADFYEWATTRYTLDPAPTP